MCLRAVLSRQAVSELFFISAVMQIKWKSFPQQRGGKQWQTKVTSSLSILLVSSEIHTVHAQRTTTTGKETLAEKPERCIQHGSCWFTHKKIRSCFCLKTPHWVSTNVEMSAGLLMYKPRRKYALTPFWRQTAVSHSAWQSRTGDGRGNEVPTESWVWWKCTAPDIFKTQHYTYTCISCGFDMFCCRRRSAVQHSASPHRRRADGHLHTDEGITPHKTPRQTTPTFTIL